MCGRFANALNRNDYRRAVARQLPRDTPPPRPSEDADDYRPSYNVAPHSRVPVIRRALPGERQQGSENEDAQDELILQTMKWGLVPRSAKHPPSGPDAFRTINARDDTIFSSSRSMWHPLLPSQRCVIFCQGFYEWQKRPLGSSESESKVERVPHFVGMCDDGEGRTDAEGKERRLMPLAGLWEKVTYEGQTEPLYTFTIITTESNKQLNFLVSGYGRRPFSRVSLSS